MTAIFLMRHPFPTQKCPLITGIFVFGPKILLSSFKQKNGLRKRGRFFACLDLIYRDCSGRWTGRHKCWQIRSSGKSQADRGKHILPVFSGSRNVAPDQAKCLRTAFGAEATGYFLLYFHHPNISFRLVIVKRNAEIIHKKQNSLFVIIQPAQEILRWALLLRSALLLDKFAWF